MDQNGQKLRRPFLTRRRFLQNFNERGRSVQWMKGFIGMLQGKQCTEDVGGHSVNHRPLRLEISWDHPFPKIGEVPTWGSQIWSFLHCGRSNLVGPTWPKTGVMEAICKMTQLQNHFFPKRKCKFVAPHLGAGPRHPRTSSSWPSQYQRPCHCLCPTGPAPSSALCCPQFLVRLGEGCWKNGPGLV